MNYTIEKIEADLQKVAALVNLWIEVEERAANIFFGGISREKIEEVLSSVALRTAVEALVEEEGQASRN